MAHPHLALVRHRSVTPSESDLDGWEKVAGSPTMKTWTEYSAEDGPRIAGWWEATPGTYRVTYAASEFVHLLDGRITITPGGGDPCPVGSGGAFVVEEGFEGTRCIHEKVLEHLAIRLT